MLDLFVGDLEQLVVMKHIDISVAKKKVYEHSHK